MEQWQGILSKVLKHGEQRSDRTGVGTLSLFGEQIVFGCRDSFPAVTTKKLFFNQMAAELACFLQGAQTLEEFHHMGCTIWDGNGKAGYWLDNPNRRRGDGDLGRIYGVQWRDWISVLNYNIVQTDQLANLINGLRHDPYSRRHVVTAFNPGELDQMCLPPCHLFFQCYVSTDGRLDMTVYMRSVDLFVGLPFDVASYALLMRLIVQTVPELRAGFLTFFLGDAHIYKNHLDQVATVLAREPFEAPQLMLDPKADVFNFRPEQALMVGYTCHDSVPATLNV